MRISTLSGTRVAIAVAAVIGAAACLFATLISYWTMIGATPAALYRRGFELATMTRIGGLPAEFVGACWFLMVALLYIFTWTRCSRLPVFVFASAVPIATAAIWQASARQFHVVPVTVAAGAAALILASAALEEAPPFGAALRNIVGDLRAILRRPAVLGSVLGFVWLTTVAAEFVILKADGVSARLASKHEFQTWWAAQARRDLPELVRPDAIRLVVFTDYQCPACSALVPQYEALIDSYRRGHEADIEIAIRDFPLEVECNPGLDRDLHPMACEAAAAVRLLAHERGADAAADIGRWLYEHREGMSIELLKHRLDADGLRASFERHYAELVHEIERDTALGRRLGVRGTPTFFLDGVKLPDTSPASFEIAMQYEMERRWPPKASIAVTGTQPLAQ